MTIVKKLADLQYIKGRSYAHFDNKISMKTAWDYVSNANKIIHHAFYPFIFFEKDYTGYKHRIDKTNRRKKIRELCYSSHLDRCIYQYYGFKLNGVYNQWLMDHDLNDTVVAYRNNLHQSNINFAKRAFDFIKKNEDCFIFVGDLEKFFDSLDHKYLKSRLCQLLNCQFLPNDYYLVYRSITKFAKVNLTDLLVLNGLTSGKNIVSLTNWKKLNKQDRVLGIAKFREAKKRGVNGKKFIHVNIKGTGIPQGSAISGVLANIYMTVFDTTIYDYVKKFNGLYMRYSDDFILVFPKCNLEILKSHYQFIMKTISETKNIKLEPEKTNVLQYTNGEIKDKKSLIINTDNTMHTQLNYLGFSFDGKYVSIRDKTIGKYYRRMYKKIRTIQKCNGISKNGKKISCKNLYDLYSERVGQIPQPKKKCKFGNFLKYVNRAKKVFGENEHVDTVAKRHMAKIRKKLKRM